MSKMLLSCPKWGRLNFEHFAASPSALYSTYTIQTTRYIRGEYRSSARRQGGTTSGNYVPQATRPLSHTRVVLIDIHSTADEVPANVPTFSVYADILDPINAPFATVKISYRPRGTRFFHPFPEAQLILLFRTVDSRRGDHRTRCRSQNWRRVRGQRQEAC